MPQPLENLREVRLQKLKKLRELGIDPYPATWKFGNEKWEVRSAIKDVKSEQEGKEVITAGRILALRSHGKLVFADLRDETGQIQLAFKQNQLPVTSYQLLPLLDIADFLGAKGKLFTTQAGELTIEVSDFQILAKSLRPLPSKFFGLKDTEERYRQRYLDLIVNTQVKEVFLKRAQIINELRNYLNQRNFIEVETPVLQPIYGGASARPFVTHHHVLSTNLYLRISDELYLKRLVVGSLEKVYEFGKDFRNEGIDRQHNPEFTQLEFYWAYANYEDLMDLTEDILTSVINKVVGGLKIQNEDTQLDFSRPWRRISFRDLLWQETGIDINLIKTEEALLKKIQARGIKKLDLKGAVGFGSLVDELYKKTCRHKLTQPTFLLDYPCEMIALAKRKEDDTSKIASFQLLVKGFELIKAYNELNDPQDQKERWLEMEKLAQKGLVEHEALDEDYLRALEYGMPPTAGWGLGVDRLVAILTNQPSLKDVILFPTLRPR